MKVFQILNGYCYWDATSKHPTLESTRKLYSLEIHFEETPDYVYEGWGYDETKTGDARFLQPPFPVPYEWIDEITGNTHHWEYIDGYYHTVDADGNRVHPESVEAAFDKYQDALAALALLDIYPEEVADDV